MKLHYITCSGANEYTDIRRLAEIFSFYRNFRQEASISVSEKTATLGSGLYWWIESLYREFRIRNKLVDFGLRVSGLWADDFCSGKVAPELARFLSLKDCSGLPLFKRIRLDFEVFDEEVLISVLQKYSHFRFILSYNEKNAELIRNLYQREICFDCLCDFPSGEWHLPDEFSKKVFGKGLYGYSGKWSVDNIVDELNLMQKMLPEQIPVFIDADEALRDGNGHFSLDKCYNFLQKVTLWQGKQQ